MSYVLALQFIQNKKVQRERERGEPHHRREKSHIYTYMCVHGVMIVRSLYMYHMA